MKPPHDRSSGPRPSSGGPRRPSSNGPSVGRDGKPAFAGARVPGRDQRSKGGREERLETKPSATRLSIAPRPEVPRSDTVRAPSASRPDSPRPPRHDSGPRSQPRATPEAPRGTVWLYGQHAIAAALANPHRRLRRLLLTEEAETALAARLPKPWPIPVERTERARIDHLLGRDAVHQGAALLADPLASPSLAQVLERPGPVLVLDQVADPRNVGAILRSAAVFGAAAVITQERNAPEETGALAKAASGALETVPLLRAVNIARTLIALKAAGCWCVGLDSGGTPLSGGALAERRVVIVLGSEGEGLRRLTRDTCDEIAGIHMPGVRSAALDSLNVSAAATVALYELARKP